MRPRTLIWAVTFVIVCGAVTTLLKTVERTVFGSSRASQTVATTVQYPSATGPADTRTVSRARLPITSASDQHWEAKKLLNEASVAQREALGHVDQWNAEIEPLRTDEVGEAIAVNEALVEKLAYVFEKDRLGEGDIHILGEQIALLQAHVETLADKEPPEFLSPRQMYDVHDVHSRARLAKEDWSESLKQANAIVLKAIRDVNPITEPTLQQSLEQLETDAALEILDEKIATAVTSELTAESIAEPDAQDDDKELRKKAMSPEVRSALAPFLEPRTVQPSLAGSFSIKFSRTSDKKPMSLGKLMSIGALSDSELGLKKLALIGGNRKLPEPKWSIASQPNSWNEGDEEFLRTSQQMLREFGAILVEEGLLSR